MSKRILVVEDQPDSRQIIRDMYNGRQAYIVKADMSGNRVSYNLERKRTSSTSSAGLPKRRAADTYPCDASWPGPSWQCMSLDRYTQSTLTVARHAKKSEVEGKIETQIEYQEVQEG
jgi:CheY-like chemotaxis protein